MRWGDNVEQGILTRLNPPLPYVIHYKKIKHLYVRFKNNQLIISSPLHLSKIKVLEIVKGLEPKIELMRVKSVAPNSAFVVNNQVAIFGKLVTLVIDNQELREDFFQVDSLQIKKSFYARIAPLLEAYLAEKLAFYWPLFKDSRPTPSFQLQHSKSRYGAYFFPNHYIKFNLRLIHLPPHLIDYVIVHELAHAFVQNHSRSFYNTLAKVMPEYKIRIKELKSIRMPL